MASKLIQPRKNGADLTKLNTKMQLFALTLMAMEEWDPPKAAEEIGYKHPHQAANRLMKNSAIKAFLGKEQRKRLERLEIKADDVIRLLNQIAFRDPLDGCEDGVLITDDMRKVPKHIRLCIDDVKKTTRRDEDGELHPEMLMKMSPRMSAIELLVKHHGLLEPQQVEHKMTFDLDSLSGREPEHKEVNILDAKVEDV